MSMPSAAINAKPRSDPPGRIRTWNQFLIVAAVSG
jgi:hypothetical protein